MRNVLVHYHLFKNAGSSIDRCLKTSFADQWHAFDPPRASSMYTANDLQQVIANHPGSVAFSSHCIAPPLTSTQAKIHPIVILREPISRVMSAYTFEWKKQIGLDEPKGTLAEYIAEKFKQPRCNAIEDFQTLRLAVTDPDSKSHDKSMTDCNLVTTACRFIDTLPAFGLVEQFDQSLRWLQAAYGSIFPQLDLQPVAANVTQDIGKPMSARHAEIESTIGADLYAELLLRNQMDLQLYAYACGRFSAANRHAVIAPGASESITRAA